MHKRKRIEFYEKYIRILFFFVLAFILLYLLFIDDYSFLNKYRAKKKIEIIDKKIKIMKNENKRLEKLNYKLQNDPETWEAKARELKMKRKNEKIYEFKND